MQNYKLSSFLDIYHLKHESQNLKLKIIVAFYNPEPALAFSMTYC